MTASLTWTLTDGAAGNLRQAEALARALHRPARAWTLTSRVPWKQAAPRWLPGARHAFGAAFADALVQPPTLAIGCGRQAALATRLLRDAGARAVQILDPRLSPRHWDLVIAPAHDRLRGSNVLPLLGSLNPVDEAWLAQGRQAFPALGALPGPRIALLVGGPTAHARLGVDDLQAMLRVIEATLHAQGGSLMATSSRRTPPSLVNVLRARAGAPAFQCWCGPQDGPNPYAGLLAWADAIVCTADSVNLLSEACATEVPVHVHAPAHARGRLAQFLGQLRERGRIAPLSDGLTPFPVTPLRETARVAAEVRSRLALA